MDVAPQALIEFRNLAAAGKMCEAAARIQQEIVLADSAKMRFTLRLQLCEMLVAQGVQAKFTPFARILLADIDRFSLDKWEPKLALEGLQLAYRLLLADPEWRNATDAIMARITRLDPATALGFLMPTNGS